MTIIERDLVTLFVRFGHETSYRLPYRRCALGAGECVVQRNGQVTDDQQHDDQPRQHDWQIGIFGDNPRPERQGDHGTQQSTHHAVDYEIR